MEKLSPVVLDAFGISSRNIKREKGYYLVDAAKGLVKIHTTIELEEAINLQHIIKEHLAAEGFPWTDRYYTAKTGQPYIMVGRETYVAKHQPRGHYETDLENELAVLQAFKMLGRFHMAARGIGGNPAPVPLASSLPDIFARQLSELNQAGKQARRGPRLSDFDVAFIKHAPSMAETIQCAIENLSATNYMKLFTNAITQGSLCHNAMKEENLLFSSDSTYFIDFSKAAIDLQLCDLAALIRRYAQRSSKSIPLNHLLNAYESTMPLPHGVRAILHAQLIFPWAFVKLASQYYSKKRNWTPNGLLSRMNAVLDEQKSYENYIAVANL